MVNITGISKETVDTVLDLAERFVAATELGANNLAALDVRLGTLHTDNVALLRVIKRMEEALMATIDDFAAAKGSLADAIGSLNTSLGSLSDELTAAVDRMDAALANLASAQANQITPEDVATVQREADLVRTASTAIGQLTDQLHHVAEADDNPIPPDAPPLDDTPAP